MNTSEPDLPLLDPTALETLRGALGEDVVTDLVETFLAETPALVHRLTESAAVGDGEAVAASAHSIRGSASNFGAARLVAVAGELERAGAAGTAVEGYLEAFTRAFHDTAAALTEYAAALR